jgi:class 3 adenylate cyclase/tetratricopeptide (TPR) repeat protein
MTFYEVLEQVVELLQRHGRVSYRALRRQFDLDEGYLEDLKAEIIEAQQLAIDQDGVMLVWTGGAGIVPALTSSISSADQAAQVAPPAEHHAPEAERRQLTVMFCNLVDSTVLASQLDPEDLRQVLRAYQETCADVIRRFEGYIAQYLGDGLLAYFGYPQAHEDGAQRAVHAGLGILEAMRAFQTHLERGKGVRLAVRLGIHTGLVVVGEIGAGTRKEQLALGETPNIAARLQGLAEPDTVLISAAMYRLVQGSFVCRALSNQTLKGMSQSVTCYQVLQASMEQTSLDTSTGGLTPLVNRELEVTLLRERWAQVKDGAGQVVLLNGEAGIGKSRLGRVMKEYVANESHVWLECRCSSYHQSTALYPVIDLLQRLLQWQRINTPDARLKELETVLTTYRLALAETVPFIAALLSLPLPADHYPALSLTPERQKQKTLEVLLTILFKLAAQQPVLLLIEDLHWVDPSTLDFLSLLVDQAPTVRLSILLTCRPTFRAPWSARAHVAQLTLSRLPRSHVEQMVTSVAGGKALPAEVVQQVVTRTDGVPLFVEELTKTIMTSGWLSEREAHYELTGFLPTLAIPTTLHDSLMARLDRLVTAKGVAQLAATLGRQFPYALLHAVSPLDEATLQRELGQLVEAELIYQQGFPPHATYMFKHTLIQEAAYQSLLRSTRQHYHQQSAQALAEHFPETAATQPELLAHHYTEAGLPAAAVPYWLQAGQRAVERSANIEAISHLTRGLEVLKTLPETPQRVQHELALHLALGPPLLIIKGHESPEVEQVYSRAQELCQQVGDSRQRFSVLMGLSAFYNAQGRLRTSRDLVEQSVMLAQNEHDPVLLHEAHITLGTVLFCLGEFVSARTHLEQGLALHNRQQHRSVILNRGVDSEVVGCVWLAWTLWILGYPDCALAKNREALHLAQQLSHTYSLACALFFSALFHACRREAQDALERLDVGMALSKEQGFGRWWAGGMMVRGWVLAEQGLVEEGIGQLEQGLAAWKALGGELALPDYLVRLAEAYGKGGRTHEGLRVLEEAQALVCKNAERRFEAELFRVKGELLLQQARERVSGQTAPAETSMMVEIEGEGGTQVLPFQAAAELCLRQAIHVARQQQAKCLELRAVMSLSRLLQAQGKRAEAYQLLAESYAWFTEGFETPELQAAKALLETFAHTKPPASGS